MVAQATFESQTPKNTNRPTNEKGRSQNRLFQESSSVPSRKFGEGLPDGRS